jgi:arylsulfatase A-like enzyme
VAAGFLELAVLVLQRDVWPVLSRQSLLTNRHWAWMIPVGGALIASSLGIGYGLLARRRGARAVAVGLGALLVLGPILEVRGLHPAAAAMLAAGVGWRLRGGVARLLNGSGARWAAVASIVGLSGYTALAYDDAAGREARAWKRSAAAGRGGSSVLWIVLDTARADRMSLYGSGRPTTPELERWAARGIAFDQARAAAPWTLPSHMTMLTGLWPFEHGARIETPYRGRAPLVAEVLRERGYATAGIVANFECVNACFGFDRGFDRFVDDAVNHEISPRTVLASAELGELLLPLARRLGEAWRWPPRPHVKRAPEVFALAREWLDTRAAKAPGRPYFLFLNLMDAHGPYRPPEDWTRRFWTAEVPGRVLDTTPELGFRAMRAVRAARDADRPARLAEMEAAGRQLGDLYDECLAALDARLGAFLGELEAGGVLDDTWVIITSDHGEHFGEHGHFGHGSSLYDEALRVPLVMVPPLAGPYEDLRGRRVGEVVSLRDLPATVADVVMRAGNGPFPGRSLARAWDPSAGPAEESDAPLAQLAQQRIDAGHAVDGDAVRDIDAIFARGRTLIRNRDPGGAVDELYDLEADPAQARNLADDPAEAATRGALGDALERRIRPRG